MVGSRVEVASTPADPADPSHVWASDGGGNYSIQPLGDFSSSEPTPAAAAPARGCRITIYLKDEFKEYLQPARLREVVHTHSNFVNFPIRVEGDVVNTVQALWTQPPSDVSDEDYASFYRFTTGSYDEPAYRLHFRADSPIDLKVSQTQAHSTVVASRICVRL